MSIGLIIAIIAGVVVLIGAGVLLAKRGRSGRDDRE